MFLQNKYYCEIWIALMISTQAFLASCQPKPWQIPTTLEIESKHLTPEQASAGLFGNYDKDEMKSSWVIQKERNFLNQFKGFTCKVAPETDITFQTYYAAADTSKKKQVTLAYTTNFGDLDGVECENKFGVLSLFEFKKQENAWILKAQSHIPIDLMVGSHGEYLHNHMISSRRIGKSNSAFIVELPGGGIAGVNYTFTQVIAKVDGKYKSILHASTQDSYCMYQEDSDGEEVQVCNGMSTKLDIQRCNSTFCPIIIAADESSSDNFPVVGIYRFNGKEYLK